MNLKSAVRSFHSALPTKKYLLRKHSNFHPSGVFTMWSKVPHPYNQEFLFSRLEKMIHNFSLFYLVFSPPIADCFQVREPETGTTNLLTPTNESTMKKLVKEAGKWYCDCAIWKCNQDYNSKADGKSWLKCLPGARQKKLVLLQCLPGDNFFKSKVL